jgi:hypothetical protein
MGTICCKGGASVSDYDIEVPEVESSVVRLNRIMEHPMKKRQMTEESININRKKHRSSSVL